MSTAPETLDLLAYLDQSPTPWHCARTSAERLAQAGFVALHEEERWNLRPGEGGFLVRDGALLALRLGTKPPIESGFRLIGAHTDSPNLRLKPAAEVTRAGYRTLGVEVYGGVLYHTWLDRDLGLAGRVFLRGGASGNDPTDGRSGLLPEQRLVHLRRPLCRIPSLAIHLDREVNKEGLKLNAQEHLAPMFGMAPADKDEASALRRLLGDAVGASPDAILSWDLALIDTLAATVGGLDDAFVFAPRLDNQASCHAALSALSAALPSEATQVISLYDHEEVGSLTTAGAAGPLLEHLLLRCATGTAWGGRDASGEGERFQRAMARSWQVSVDMAHAVHPNNEDRHEPQHRPLLNGGPVIKSNANQRYATTGETAALFRALCDDVGVPVQTFVMRTDLPCGTTIGPIASSQLGVRTVDVGNPMLSMHSSREQAGAHDVPRMISVLKRFLVL